MRSGLSSNEKFLYGLSFYPNTRDAPGWLNIFLAQLSGKKCLMQNMAMTLINGQDKIYCAVHEQQWIKTSLIFLMVMVESCLYHRRSVIRDIHHCYIYTLMYMKHLTERMCWISCLYSTRVWVHKGTTVFDSISETEL